MRRNWWRCLFLIQSLLIIIVISVFVCRNIIVPATVEADLSHFLEPSESPKYIPDEGYISNAKAAKEVGTQIINDFCNPNEFTFSHVTIIYDKENRLWKVEKGFFPNNGGTVVLSQDTGEVITLFLWK